MPQNAFTKPLFLILVAVVVGILLGFTESKILGVECTPVYGGGEVCPKVANGFIDKTIADKKTGVFVDNLTESDSRFNAGDIVTFKIFIKNTGEVALESVKIKDFFPNYINFLSGVGRFENRVLTINLGTLEAGESREFIIRGQVVSEDKFPSGRDLICALVNKSEMTAEVDGKISVSDAAQFCIERKVLAAKQLPAAGTANILLLTPILTYLGLRTRRLA